MTDKTDSSLSRMLTILDLFTEDKRVVSAEVVSEQLQVSLPTSYRYLKTLCDHGLLLGGSDTTFKLGPRIIVLDHLMRQGDPILQHGVPIMRDLVEQTGFDCVVSSMHGEQLLDTYREYGNRPAALSYGRGRPRPLFQGAAPKVLLASLSPLELKKIFDKNSLEIQKSGLPIEWSLFRKYYKKIQKNGYYFSYGELEDNLSALAVPMTNKHGQTTAALSLVTTVQRMSVIDPEKLIPLLLRASSEICARAN